MYKNRKYRSSRTIQNPTVEDQARRTRSEALKDSNSILSPIVENVPAKQRKVEESKKTTAGAPDQEVDNDLPSSQNLIPSSQPPTQRRYLSQRSMLCRTQSRTMSRAPNSYFEMVLMKSGADLDEPDSFVLSCDHIAFVNRFRNLLGNHQDFPANVKQFIESLQEAIDNYSTAVKLMSGCTINISGAEITVQSQDSLMMNFLMVEFLQKDLIEVLTTKLGHLSKDDKNLDADPPLLSLILSQLKFVTALHGSLLYEKIVNIFTEATPRNKKEVIAHGEYVLNPSHHDEFVEFLLNNVMSSQELLTPQTVETFTNMYLGIGIQTRLRSKILNYMKGGCSSTLFPTFTKFLLKSGCEDEEVLPNLITDLRTVLKFGGDAKSHEMRKMQLETFANIRQSLTRSKKINDTWQKVIQNLAASDLRSIDFVVLLTLVSIRENRYHYIENLIRRRIKLEHFTLNILKDARNELPAIFNQNAEIFLTMLHNFLKEKYHLVSSFARNSYKMIFAVDNDYQMKIVSTLVELACDRTSLDSTTLALEMLRELNQTYRQEMQRCELVLLPLLDRLADFSLKQFRILMELLCSMAYPPQTFPECQILQEHVDMLVKKQVISRTPLIKKQGIIGMVQLINQIIRTEDTNESNDIYDLNQSYNTVDELPDGRAKTAANYISIIFSSTVYCPNSLALFYDEMAVICSPYNLNGNAGLRPIDRHFLVWLSDLITNYFQNFFVCEEIPTGLSLEMVYENCINVPEEDASVDSELIPIAINLGGPCFKPQADATSSIIVLPPMFSLVRTLHFTRYGGNLESINALLGCAIVIPKLPGSISDFDIFDEYDEGTAKKVLNVQFYLANWFRETISAFSSQDQQMIRKKILMRLSTLIQIERNIFQILHRMPSDYVPPISNFISDNVDFGFKKSSNRPKKAANPKTNSKNKNPEENPETEGMSMLGTVRTQNLTISARVAATKEKSSSKMFLDEPPTNGMFRQMDPNILLILREKLNISISISSDDAGACIGLLEFKFIISDIVNKLESVPGIRRFCADQPSQYINYPADLIRDVVRFTPKLMEHFKQFSDRLKQTLGAVKGALGNAELFTNEMNCLKICFAFCLRLFAALFSWSGFNEESENNTLKDALKHLNNSTQFEKSNAASIEELAVQAFKNFLKIEEIVIDIRSAVHLYHLVVTIKRFTLNLDLDKSIRKLCKNLLCRKWYGYSGTIEKGTQCNLLLNELLTGFLENSDYKRIKTILQLIIEETGFLKKKEDCLKMFPNVHKANFPMLFRCLCESFINIVQESVTEYRASNVLKRWEQSCEIQNMLLEIVKSLDIPRNFSLFLKYAHMFVKVFLQHGLTVFESGLRRDAERANELLKTLQVTTRFLHNLCCHSKAIKNTAIVAQVPAVRETIENLVFRVKAALAANNCSSVFFMGNLRNKDLQGDEIRSQTSSLTNPNDDDSDEELPDDSCIDESILNAEEELPTGAGFRSAQEGSSRSNCI